MDYLSYLFFRFLVFIFRFVPFKLLYLKADFTYFLLYKVFKYRVKVVRDNLKNSFPDKTPDELLEIEKKFYKNLSDITLESIKGFSMSQKELKKRYKVVNPEVLQEFYDKGQAVIGFGSHYANWEWGVQTFGQQFPHKCIGFYKPLSNRYIDKWIKKGRAINDMHLHSIKETSISFEEKHKIPAIYIMVADQSPSNIKKAHWVHFLNRNTACLQGVGFYSKLYNLPVISGEVSRVKRGFYEVNIKVLIEDSSNYQAAEITNVMMKRLEKIIINKPEDWLWSHKRWKHNKIDL